MAIDRLGLVFAADISTALTLSGGDSVRIADTGKAEGEPYVRFRTMSDSAVNKALVLTVEWIGVKRATATNPSTTYGTKWAGATAEIAVPATGGEGTGIRVKKVSGAYDWAVQLTKVAPMASLTSSDWAFAHRLYDELHFRISAKTVYASGVTGADGESESPTACAEAWVGYIPVYAVGKIAYDLDTLDVELSRSATWCRVDDRWCVESLAFDGQGALPPYDVWGAVEGGKACIPLRHLTSMPHGTVSVRLRVNAAYKALGSTLATVEATKAVSDETQCDTPTLTVAKSGSTVSVTVGDSGDRGRPILSAAVKLRGSACACDTVEVPVGGTAHFYALGKGTHTFDAIATDGKADTAASRVATESASISDTVAKVRDMADGCEYETKYDPSYTWSGSRDQQSVKLAGRDRESVFFGHGGAATGGVDFSIVAADGQACAEAIAFAKTCLLLMPDGTRKLVAVESVASTLQPYGCDVSMSYREVS